MSCIHEPFPGPTMWCWSSLDLLLGDFPWFSIYFSLIMEQLPLLFQESAIAWLDSLAEQALTYFSDRLCLPSNTSCSGKPRRPTPVAAVAGSLSEDVAETQRQKPKRVHLGPRPSPKRTFWSGACMGSEASSSWAPEKLRVSWWVKNSSDHSKKSVLSIDKAVGW